MFKLFSPYSESDLELYAFVVVVAHPLVIEHREGHLLVLDPERLGAAQDEVTNL